MQKSLREISLQISEEDYRSDGCMHYSTIARYAREGVSCIDHLDDRVETPSLTNGSAVDAIITGGQQEFDARFMVVELPKISDNMIKIVKTLFSCYKDSYTSVEDIPTDTLAAAFNTVDKRDWKTETKAKKVIEEGSEYYKLLYLAGDKIILSTEQKVKIDAQVRALKDSPATSWYFQEDNPFEDVERLYQLKFKTERDGIPYSCMMDLVVVDHENKVIYPVDLKTSSHREDEFFKSFIDWRYDIQARSYYRTLKDTIIKDPYFSNFRIEDYRFIVVNKETLTPLVWIFEDTKAYGDLTYGRNRQYVLKDPYDLAGDIKYYQEHTNDRVSRDINMIGDNSITTFLNK